MNVLDAVIISMLSIRTLRNWCCFIQLGARAEVWDEKSCSHICSLTHLVTHFSFIQEETRGGGLGPNLDQYDCTDEIQFLHQEITVKLQRLTLIFKVALRIPILEIDICGVQRKIN